MLYVPRLFSLNSYFFFLFLAFCRRLFFYSFSVAHNIILSLVGILERKKRLKQKVSDKHRVALPPSPPMLTFFSFPFLVFLVVVFARYCSIFRHVANVNVRWRHTICLFSLRNKSNRHSFANHFVLSQFFRWVWNNDAVLCCWRGCSCYICKLQMSKWLFSMERGELTRVPCVE